MNSKHFILPGFALLLGTVFLGTAVARELTADEKTVVCKLKEVVKDAGRDGFELAFWPIVRKGPAKANAPLTIRLDPAIEYLFVGYCDENCTDVNLSIKTLDGKVLQSEKDTLSVMPFKPPAANIYELNLNMTSCSRKDGCVYGIGILAPKGVKVPYAPSLPKDLAKFEFCQI
ncbi:hypothetical protein PA905_36970 [Planktothrix agardhii CCAP 1459/11A]|jgi:hypothetical protein|uniref:Uncharacterized protein n=1 Tax=Planktothrix agardhii CCAP 1459/11A TaxID=282420 RepID=A0A4P5ZGV5_PLAAG|nr:hypothetical protein [Planktothrix agardhii]GDZ95400.1 hypothetical protein PA905_36970 [Planktothrix agardhii CCAP 1459/11A]